MAELTDINDADRVTIMNYILGETNWADFMSDFIEEVNNNRESGLIKLRVHADDRIFSWVFKKLDGTLVGVEDGDGEVLYELGNCVNRWLKEAHLTGYTGSYEDLFGTDGIVGVTLSKQAFEDAALTVLGSKGEPLKWKRSLGVASLMISEAAKFVPFRNVLAEKFVDGSEMLLAKEAEGEYDWVVFMLNHWGEISECAQRFIYPECVFQHPRSMLGAVECLYNPTAAYRALSLKCYDKFLDDPVGSGGVGGSSGGHGVNVSCRSNANLVL